MGIEELMDNYIDNSSLEELNSLVAIIDKRRTRLRDKERKELALKVKRAFDDYSIHYGYKSRDSIIEVNIIDEYGESTHQIGIDQIQVTEDGQLIFHTPDEIDVLEA